MIARDARVVSVWNYSKLGGFWARKKAPPERGAKVGYLFASSVALLAFAAAVCSGVQAFRRSGNRAQSGHFGAFFWLAVC